MDETTEPRKRVLIVDDESGFTRLLKLTLERTGKYTVREQNEWKAYAIEINLRKGGTTHPFLTLQFLTDGAYDADKGSLRVLDMFVPTVPRGFAEKKPPADEESSPLRRRKGGPKDSAVLYTPDDIVADIEGRGLAVRKAQRVHRVVDTDAGEMTAIDALVRAVRTA